MPRGYSNYEFVVNSAFQPYTFKELIQPFAIYKDAYDQTEAAYENLTNQSDKFKYLSETLPEGSKARQIYEGYANDLSKQAESLSKHGLTMLNRRGLTDMKRRYQGEIGRLVNADTALQEERKLRRTIGAKDNSMLYATDNLNIEDFLDGGTPNLYSISGNELYTRGAAAGQAASKRVYSAGDNGSTLGGYYRDYVTRLGYDPSKLNQWQQEMLMNDFTQQVSVLPELQQAANQILEANGVNKNLTGANLRKAQQQVIRGIVDGAVYSEDHKPIRDEGVVSAAQQMQIDRQAAMNGLTWNNKTNSWDYDLNKDPNYQRRKALAGDKEERDQSNKGKRSGSSKDRYSQLSKGVKIEWDDDPEAEGATYTSEDLDFSEGSETAHSGKVVTYDELPQYAKDIVDRTIGENGHTGLHRYYFQPFERGFFGDTEAVLEIIPYKVTKYNSEETSDDMENDPDLQ